jgi:hypothetical protein
MLNYMGLRRAGGLWANENPTVEKASDALKAPSQDSGARADFLRLVRSLEPQRPINSLTYLGAGEPKEMIVSCMRL